MQKKISIISGVLALVLTTYACSAWYNTHGIHIYLISYELGRVFIYSCLPVAIAAVICWGVFIFFIRKVWKEHKETEPRQKEKKTKAVKVKNVCVKCGEPLGTAAKFCNKCGTAVNPEQIEVE